MEQNKRFVIHISMFQDADDVIVALRKQVNCYASIILIILYFLLFFAVKLAVTNMVADMLCPPNKHFIK